METVRLGSRSLLLAFLILAAAPLTADTSTVAPRPKDDAHYGETKAQRDLRMGWWRQAKFGMFIHWGVYSVPAGVYRGVDMGGGPGEWIMHDSRIPVDVYAHYAKRFNPVKFDADAWVRLARDAGMKYMVITAKHHDGFAMFDTKVGGFNIMQNSPFKRDPLRELAAACRKYGIRLGFYYSQNQDWHQPGGSEAGGPWDDAQRGSTDDYLKAVSLPQVRELLTNYGPGIPAVFWWDTPQAEMTPPRAALFQPLLKLRPDVITNNRLSSGAPDGLGYPGDTESPEQHIPVGGYPGRDWETCMTINNTWGYKSNDTNWKSTETLLRNLVDIASKGGNYLLNVGPDATGTIPEPETTRLREVGAWLAKNGQSIYGSQPSPFKQAFDWGRVTQKGRRLYLHVFDWPADRILRLPLRNRVLRAFLLTAPYTHLDIGAEDDSVLIRLPPAGYDPLDSVIAVDLDGQVVPATLSTLKQHPDASFTLAAEDADLLNDSGKVQAVVENPGDSPNIGYWNHDGDYARWQAWARWPGTYAVSLEYSAAPAAGKVNLLLSVGTENLRFTLPGTADDWKTYRTAAVGTIAIHGTGPLTVTIKRDGADPGVCNLRGIFLETAR